MDKLVELKQRRFALVTEMRALVDGADAETRDLSGEESESFERLRADVRALDAQIAREEELRLLAAEGPPAEAGAPAPGAGGERGERRSAFLAYLRRGERAAPEQRALVENAAGEILVPEDLEAEILRATPRLTAIRPLASVRGTRSDRIRRRSLDEVATGWGRLETGAQALADSMPGVPEQTWVYVEDLYGLAKIGEDELEDADEGLEAFVQDSFSRAIAEAEDTGFTVGAGHGANQPEGLLAGVALARVAAAQAAGVRADDFLKLVYAVPAQYRRNGAFVMASSTELALRTLKDADGQYLWQPSLQAGRPNTFLGFPVHDQEDVPGIPAAGAAGDVAIFGDLDAGYRIYDRRGMTLQRLSELYAEEGMVGFKVRFRVGGAVRIADALRVLRVPA